MKVTIVGILFMFTVVSDSTALILVVVNGVTVVTSVISVDVLNML